MIKRDDPLLCTLAYHGLVVDTDAGLDPCCQYNNLMTSYDTSKLIKFYEYDKYQELVQKEMDRDFKQGIKHDKCSKCWTEEEAGLTTIRQHWNRAFGLESNPNVVPENPLFHVEFRLGNFCNLKCLMCHPIASSSIAAEQAAHKEKFKELRIYNEVSVDPYWETPEFEEFTKTALKNVKYVHMTGGEPFIIPEVLSIIDKIMPKCETVNLSFNTNLTRVSARLLERLKHFKKLNLYVSLEGTGEMNDYIRYGSTWSELLENIEKFNTQAPYAVINVQHVFQHTSVYAFPALAKFCTERKLRLFPTLVQGRDFLAFNSVPPADLAKFKEWLESTDLLSEEHRTFMLNIINKAVFDIDMYKKYRKYVELLDSIRGTNYDEIFKPAQVDS